ncbi:MAG TPA: hypothetical protein VMV46_06525 [Thermoanaerobaculia bacterium]|nr:hypothetical protein [Thermoanaerobaculia bacterium]
MRTPPAEPGHQVAREGASREASAPPAAREVAAGTSAVPELCRTQIGYLRSVLGLSAD